MKTGRYFISTGFRTSKNGDWHFLIAAHRRCRLEFVRPNSKPEYRRLYIGNLEFEWSRTTLNHPKP